MSATSSAPDPASDPSSGTAGGPQPSPLSGADHERAMERYQILAPHLHDKVPLTVVHRQVTAVQGTEVTYRTLQRWLAAYRASGLAGLARADRSDKGHRKLPAELVEFIEGLALKKPRPSSATIHRQAASLAAARGWAVPGYRTVARIVVDLDAALMMLAHEGTKAYQNKYDLVRRREAAQPNEIWQADHTELDLWVVDDKGKPSRPWLTAIEDDHSRAVAGYAVNLEAPSAMTTALAFRQAIWRKAEPDWHVCGIPQVFHLDHGSDFTSAHLEQVMADLKVRPVYAKKGLPRGHGKIERLIETFCLMCLPHLPGYAPAGHGLTEAERKARASLTLPELDAEIGRFIREVYNRRPHSETGRPPQERWETCGFVPRMPDSLEQLDLLLCTVAKSRKIHPDGIHFLNLRYLDPVLAFYVTEQATIRYDPRDITEIRVYLQTSAGDEQFLCRALCPELAGVTISLKEINAARNARRRQLRSTLSSRTALVDRLLAAHAEPLPAAYPLPYATSGAPLLLSKYDNPAGPADLAATSTGPPATAPDGASGRASTQPPIEQTPPAATSPSTAPKLKLYRTE